jgi:hypothetical protein
VTRLSNPWSLPNRPTRPQIRNNCLVLTWTFQVLTIYSLGIYKSHAQRKKNTWLNILARKFCLAKRRALQVCHSFPRFLLAISNVIGHYLILVHTNKLTTYNHPHISPNAVWYDLGGAVYLFVVFVAQFTDGGDSLQIWRVAADILNKQSRAADKGWSANLGLGVGIQLAVKISLLRKTTRSLGPGRIPGINDPRKRKWTWDLVPGMLEVCIGQVHSGQ